MDLCIQKKTVNILDKDSDNDELLDGYEFDNGIDPADSDSDDDSGSVVLSEGEDDTPPAKQPVRTIKKKIVRKKTT